MDTEVKPAADASPEDADLVVIDRRALKEMLTAVVNTLRASQSLQELDAPAPEQAEQYAKVQQTVSQARDALIDGVERIASAIDELPSAVMKPMDDQP